MSIYSSLPDFTKNPNEHVEQIRFCKWLNLHQKVYTAIPNANILLSTLTTTKRHSVTSYMAQEGYQPGFPDLVIFPDKDTPLIFLEMKRIPTKDLSSHKICNCRENSQLMWANKLQEGGYNYILAHGSEDAIKQVQTIIDECNQGLLNQEEGIQTIRSNKSEDN